MWKILGFVSQHVFYELQVTEQLHNQDTSGSYQSFKQSFTDKKWKVFINQMEQLNPFPIQVSPKNKNK